MRLNLPLILIGLFLIALSETGFALYNPYINYGYARPYYTQYNGIPGYPRDPLIYGGIMETYSYDNGWESYYENNFTYNAYSSACYYGCGTYYTAPYYAPYSYVYTPLVTANYATTYYAASDAYYVPTVVSPTIVYWG